jgi:hypothetical protein
MAPAIEFFKQRLEEATSTKGPDGIAGAAVIAVDANGKFTRKLFSLPC